MADREEELEFTDTALLHAMVFSGLRSGIGPFPSILRDTPDFAWIQAVKVAFLETLIPGCYETPQVPRFALKVTIPKASGILTIQLVRDGVNVPGALLNLHPVIASPQVISSSMQPPALPNTVQVSEAVPHPDTTSLQMDKTLLENATPEDKDARDKAIATAEHQENSVVPEKLIDRLRHTEETDAELERVALQVCRHLQWQNCIRRSFNLSRVEFYMKNTDQGLILELVGSVPSEEQIIWKRFRRRIDESEPEEFRQAVYAACGP